MRTAFVTSVMQTLLDEGWLSQSSSVLAVCASDAEHGMFQQLGMTDVHITNLDHRHGIHDEYAPFESSIEDAQALSFGDGSFDFGFVADGLHHCRSPHRALLELYRVARRGVVVVESRDNLLVRLSQRLGHSQEYEIDAVAGNGFETGGADNGPIPNYVYRWTEAEFEKTLRSFDPSGKQTFRFFYGLNAPDRGPDEAWLGRLAASLAGRGAKVVTRVFPKQCNSFAMVALKPRLPGDLWPWLVVEEGTVRFNREFIHPRPSSPSGSRDGSDRS